MKKRFALCEGGGMTRSIRESGESRALRGEKTVLNRHQRFANSAQVGMHGERLPSCIYPPNDRVLYRDHARLGLTFVHGACSARKGRERDCFDRMPPDLRDRT